eukprot:4328285-Amphidinium_carterae.1
MCWADIDGWLVLRVSAIGLVWREVRHAQQYVLHPYHLQCVRRLILAGLLRWLGAICATCALLGLNGFVSPQDPAHKIHTWGRGLCGARALFGSKLHPAPSEQVTMCIGCADGFVLPLENESTWHRAVLTPIGGYTTAIVVILQQHLLQGFSSREEPAGISPS